MREKKIEKNNEWYETMKKEREKMIEKIASIDQYMEDLYLEKYDNINVEQIKKSLREITIKRKGVPVLVGSSFKYKGVQPLMVLNL
jgi:elongation factor G